MATRPIMTFRGVDVQLAGTRVLADVDLEIGRGEFLCLMGPSGCGKTTLLRVAAGLHGINNGSATYNGKPINGPQRDVAVVFQDYADALLPWRTSYGNIELVYETLGVPKSERPDRIASVLSRVGLSKHAKKYPRQMSGGMQQRLQIARCLAQEPKVWLMDEPFGALDAMTRQSLQDELLELAASTEATFLFVTHDIDEAVYLGDRVVAMKAHPGRVGISRDIALPRPRSQRTTPSEPEFHYLRRLLIDFIREQEQ